MDFLTPDSIAALLTLTAMEVVLGIDNIVFLTILVSRLPKNEQPKARSLGLILALGMRLLLLFSLSWVMGLTQPLFTAFGVEISGRDLILLGGGLFLMAKATHEIHQKVEGGGDHSAPAAKKGSFTSTLIQIALIDIVFSLDSVITAVGMAKEVWIMVTAMIVSVGVMLVSAGSIGHFVEKHPTIKLLALSFLLLIGVMLIAEGSGSHVNKGYIYFAMAFSLGVEMLNLRYYKKQAKKVKAGS